MPVQRALVVLAAVVMCAGGAVECEPGTSVLVRVYDAASIDTVLKDAALRTADATLASASIGVAWVHCESTSAQPPCDAPSGGELILRIVRTHPKAGRRLDLPLGDAFVVAHGGTGVLATVYVDSVRRLASAAGSDLPTLLGYAIAHELGHLLLSSTGHGSHGLMRPVWQRQELIRALRDDWTFTEEEGAAMRARLLRRRAASEVAPAAP